MVAKAVSIEECPDLEALWDSGKVLPVTRQIQLSHSDIGPYVHFVCPEEHHVVGPAMVTCLKGGVWDDVTEPYCSASSLYGIPQSDTILIGVLAGSGAIVIITITIILTHLFCLRSMSSRKDSSSEGLHRSHDSFSSATFYVDDQSYCAISSPTCPTLNGKPLETRSRGHLSNMASTTQYHNSLNSQPLDAYGSGSHPVASADYFGRQDVNHAHASNSNGQVTTIGDDSAFVNYGYSRDNGCIYPNHSDHITALSENETSFQMSPLYQKTDGSTRRNSSSVTNQSSDHVVQAPLTNLYSVVNRTVL